MSASPAAATSGRVRLVVSSSAPTSAPVNIASTAAILRTEPWPEPPVTGESAASAVSVIVSTVVVRSGTPMRRTVALRTPMRYLDDQRAGDVLGMAVSHPVREDAAAACSHEEGAQRNQRCDDREPSPASDT